MNEYDTNRIYDLAKNINYYKTEYSKEADCYVLNTCHIREKATEKVYHDVGRIKKEFRNKKKPIVIVAGCVAQAEGEIIIERENYIDAIIGPQSYHKFNKTILEIENKSKKINSTEFEVIDKFDNFNLIKNSDSKVSSFLTIQEGCDKFCKFCVVPYTRGAEFSRSIDEIFNEANDLVNNGVKEITLLGQNVNAYNFKGEKLSDLIGKISEIKDLKRIRYTTSHPKDFTKDLIEAHDKYKKLMPLIHLPVQSGSNYILKKMNRKHTVEDYYNLINQIKEINPLIEFTSDFIIGFPGEREKDFLDTLKLLKNIKFVNSYSFIFSPRPGTPAFHMKRINDSTSKDRLINFQKIASEIKNDYKKKQFNKNSFVLFENETYKKKEFFGRDEFQNAVIVRSEENLIGSIREVNILGGNQNTLFGKIMDKENKNFFAA